MLGATRPAYAQGLVPLCRQIANAVSLLLLSVQCSFNRVPGTCTTVSPVGAAGPPGPVCPYAVSGIDARASAAKAILRLTWVRHPNVSIIYVSTPYPTKETLHPGS